MAKKAKFLIVRKPTNLEQHGASVREQIANGFISPEHLVYLQQAHQEHYACLKTVNETLDELGCEGVEVARGEKWPKGVQFTAIITVGGDGTLLSASQYVCQTDKVIGLRSSQSSVGYLCAGGITEVKGLVLACLEKTMVYETCSRLVAKITRVEEGRDEISRPVLNDFLFANRNPAATTRYSIQLADQQEFHKSSGVWVSTATGSTAGISAAGGIDMKRHDQRFQYLPRELYLGDGCPYALVGGFFDPEKDRLAIESRNERAILALDGQRAVVHLKFGDQICFLKGPPIEIAKPQDPKPRQTHYMK